MENKLIYYINSNNRLNGTHSDFTHKIFIPPNSDFTHVSVISCNIPRSFYLVQSNKNTFTLTENTTDYTVTMTPGCYTRKSFSSVLQTALNDAGAYTYTITYSNISNTVDDGKFLYTVTGNSGNTVSFSVGAYLFESMGFDKNSVNSFTSTIKSTNVCKLTVEDSLFIHSDIVEANQNNILQEIYSVDSLSFGHVVFYNNSIIETGKKLSNNKNGVYRFYLCDENSNALDLNGLNWTITLLLYKENSIWDLLKQYIKYKLYSGK